MIKQCLICNKDFFCKPVHFYSGRAKFCSQKCHYKAMEGNKLSPEAKQKFIDAGYKAWKGRHHSLETRKKISEIQKGKFGKQAKGWKGGRRLDSYGYVRIIIPEFRICKDGKKKSKYEMEHRIVMENHLGRKLKKYECVHHKNGIKTDNRLENLSIVIRQKHYGKIVCPHCLKEFLIK